MILRDYQSAAVDAALSSRSRTTILHAPTGAGKTVIAAEVIRRHPGRALMLAHREELIDQSKNALARIGIDAGTITQASGYDARIRVHVGMIQTVARRPPCPAELVIVDECHLSMAHTYQAVLQRYPSARVIGLTATPSRLDGKPLGGYWQEMIPVADVPSLISQGHLAPARVYVPDFAARLMDGARVSTNGDYCDADMRRVEVRNADIVAEFEAHSVGRKSLIFCVTVEHARELARRIPGSVAVDSSGRWDERRAATAGLRDGKYRAICNVALFTEGYDDPSIDCIALARPTASRALCYQMIGRGMRPHAGKSDCLVLDFVGNVARHGDPNQANYWPLEQEKLPPPRPPALPINIPAPVDVPRDASALLPRWLNGSGDVVYFNMEEAKGRPAAIPPPLPAEQRSAGGGGGINTRSYKEVDMRVRPAAAAKTINEMSYAELLLVAKKRGYKPGWAWHVDRANKQRRMKIGASK